jgi:phage baseplate assembly protein W
MADFYGFNPPFLVGNQGRGINVLSRQEGVRLIQNDVLQLLLTSPGQRVMRPNFGTLINFQLFDPLDPEADGNFELRENIADAIAEHEPRVTVTGIELIDNTDKNLLEIIVQMELSSDANKTFSVTAFINQGA